MGQFCFGNADARVFDGYLQEWLFCLKTTIDRQINIARFRGEFQGIGQQIGNDLPQFFRVVGTIQFLQGGQKMQLFLLAFCQRMKGFKHVAQKRDDISLDEPQRHFPTFQPGQVEHFIDQLQELLPIAQDHLLFEGQVFVRFFQGLLGHAHDHGEGRAEFVGDVGV